VVRQADLADPAAAEVHALGFEYHGLSDPSRFSAEHIEKCEAVLRVSRVLMGSKTVPYVRSLYSAKNPPKQVGVSIRIILSSTPDIL
jgi:hypothetical protein